MILPPSSSNKFFITFLSFSSIKIISVMVVKRIDELWLEREFSARLEIALEDNLWWHKFSHKFFLLILIFFMFPWNSKEKLNTAHEITYEKKRDFETLSIIHLIFWDIFAFIPASIVDHYTACVRDVGKLAKLETFFSPSYISLSESLNKVFVNMSSTTVRCSLCVMCHVMWADEWFLCRWIVMWLLLINLLSMMRAGNSHRMKDMTWQSDVTKDFIFYSIGSDRKCNVFVLVPLKMFYCTLGLS